MSSLRRLPSEVSIEIPRDADGYLGRECPETSCEGYFKIKPGTGLPGESSCTCPYCGHKGDTSDFHTKDQIEYAKSVLVNQVTGAFLKDLKDMARSTRGGFITMKVTGSPHPIRRYHEKQLETHMVCDGCSLAYAIYGLFAFCPDCGSHNSGQMLDKNLGLAEKMLALAQGEGLDAALVEQLVGDALENVVSAFDGFGRELTRVNASRASNPKMAASLSFQNLSGAQKNVQTLFGGDLAATLSSAEWITVCRGFQKRHLISHRMGVVDDAYLAATKDPDSVRGRKVPLQNAEVLELVALVRRLAAALTAAVARQPPTP